MAEMLVTAMLLGIMLSLALPSFYQSRLNAIQRGALQTLSHTLQEAQSIADRDRSTVSLCPSVNGTACATGNDWSQGWLLFEGSGANPVTPDRIVRVMDKQNERITVTLLGATAPLRVSHRGNPAVTLQTGSLTVCDERGDDAGKALIIGRGGLSSFALDTNGNAKVNLHDGSDISC
jgi:type IV fimbrial biogenesis protein FimT